MDFKDYYAILGVSPETPSDEIKRAYRKLARKYHPDVSKEPNAEARFKEINEAWEVLQDPNKRKQYDQIRAGGWQPNQGFDQSMGSDYFSGDHPEDFSFQAGGEDFSDFFNSIFGRAAHQRQARAHPMKGRDFHVKVDIPLTVAYQGGTQALQLQIGKQTKTLQVKIPAGVTNGSQIRLKGQGGEGIHGGMAGDLYIDIHLQKDPLFSVHQKDIYIKVPISPWEAALGASIAVPTLGGQVSIKIPKNAQSEQKLRLKGRGLPGNPPGDQYAELQVKLPSADNENTKRLYEEMAKQIPFNPREGWGESHV